MNAGGFCQNRLRQRAAEEWSQVKRNRHSPGVFNYVSYLWHVALPDFD